MSAISGTVHRFSVSQMQPNIRWSRVATVVLIAAHLSVAYLSKTPDWGHYYWPSTWNYFIEGLATPAYALFLFKPLAMLGIRGGLVLAMLNIGALYLACNMVGGNFNWLLLSAPALTIISYGQLDGLVALGLVMGLRYASKRRIILGAASLLLIGLKPHMGLIIGLGILAKGRWAMVRPALLASSLVFISFLAYPERWLEWLAGLAHLSEFINLSYNIGLFPWGLALLAAGLVLSVQTPGLILAGLLSLPYVGYYSVIVVMVYRWPWWIYLLTWITVLGGPFIWLSVASLVLYSYAKTKFKG